MLFLKMASKTETWTQLKSSQIMPYKEFFELLSCVVCHDEKSKEKGFLSCGHAVCLHNCAKSLEMREKGILKLRCIKCSLKTKGVAWKEMLPYMTEVMSLRQGVDDEWGGVGALRVFCDHCQGHHGAEKVEAFRYFVKVCLDCRPPKILCAVDCHRKHAEINEGHEPVSFEPEHHEWHARYLCILPQTGASTNVAAGATDATDAGPNPHQEMKSQLLDDIDATLALFLEEETIRRETLRKLEQLQPPASGELPYLLSTIALEKIRYGVLLRTAALQTILKALIYFNPQELSLFQKIQKRLSLRRLQDLCYYMSNFQMDSSSWTYVVPAYTLGPVHHHFQKSVKELISTEVIITNGERSEDGDVVEIGLLEQKQCGGWSEVIRKDFPYGSIASLRQKVPEAIKILQITENLYVVSCPLEIILIRLGEDGAWCSQQFSPVQPVYAFGRGLWWNDSSLFATVVGTNQILRWTFEEDSFVVDMHRIPAIRITSVEANCNLAPFTTDDTIAEVNGKLCICYDRSDPDRKLSLDHGSILVCELINVGSYYVLKSTKEFEQVSLAQPRLLGVWGESLNIVLLDVQAQTPTVYFLAGEDGPQESSLKMEFKFKKAVAVKDMWLQSDGDLCLTVESNSGQVENLKIKLH